METSVNYTAYFLPIKLNILKGKILNFPFLFGDFVLRQEPDMLAKKKKIKIDPLSCTPEYWDYRCALLTHFHFGTYFAKLRGDHFSIFLRKNKQMQIL